VFLSLPAWALVLTAVVVPLVWGVVLSTRDQRLSRSGATSFVGAQNYRAVLGDDAFRQALWTTVAITGLGLLVQLPAGLLLASVLHRQLRGTRMLRSALLMPMLLTPVAVGLMWRFMFNTDLGVVNWLFGTAGAPRVDWLGGQTSAKIAIVVVDSWQSIPFVMLLLLAGLQSMPSSPFEAAQVDGAGGWQTFRYITLPLLAPTVLVVLMIRIVEGVKLFDVIFIVTQGGPGTATQNLSVLDYRLGLTFLDTSRAAALGVLLAVLLLPVYWLWSRASRP
jgi:multiple sugar transport system permease protein